MSDIPDDDRLAADEAHIAEWGDLGPHYGSPQDYIDAVRRLRAEVGRLEADGERLDWLEADGEWVTLYPGETDASRWEVGLRRGGWVGGGTLREAIDAARDTKGGDES